MTRILNRLKKHQSKVLLKGIFVFFMPCVVFAQQSQTASLENRLLTEVQRNNIQAVESLIAQGADVNVAGNDGSTPLLWAVYQHEFPIVQALINAGAEVNISNRYGVSPLLQAARSADAESAHALLNAGADPTNYELAMEPPLMAAAASGLTSVVERMIDLGVEVNAYEQNQFQTALMWAAEQGQAGAITALLNAGAHPDMQSISIINELERTGSGHPLVSFPAGEMTALMFAARQGHEEAITALLDGGADPNIANDDGVTALMLSVVNDELDSAVLLLEYGANPNDGSMYELVALHNSRVGSTVNDPTRPRVFSMDNDITPAELLNRMLEYGGDPNYVSNHLVEPEGIGHGRYVNVSAYNYALSQRDVELVRLMLESGTASPHTTGEGLQPPLNIILATALVERRGGFFALRDNLPNRYPVTNNRQQTIDLLMDFGADVNQTSSEGDTPLHVAARQNDVDMIQVLFNRDADLNSLNQYGFTPLDAALGRLAPPSYTKEQLNESFFRAAPAPTPQVEAITLLRDLMQLSPMSQEEINAIGEEVRLEYERRLEEIRTGT